MTAPTDPGVTTMFRTIAMPRSRVLLAALVVVASACGGDTTAEVTPDAAADMTVDASMSSVVVDATSATDAAAPTTDPTATDATEVPTDAGTAPGSTVTVDMTDQAQCLTGRWTLGAEQVQRVFDETQLGSAAGAAGATLVTTGSGLLELDADGTYAFSPSYAVTITVDGEVAEGQWSGTQAGVWGVEGTTLTMTEASNDISGTITLFGSAMPLPLPASFSGAAEIVNCSPMTFEIAIDSSVGVFSQVLVLAD